MHNSKINMHDGKGNLQKKFGLFSRSLFDPCNLHFFLVLQMWFLHLPTTQDSGLKTATPDFPPMEITADTRLIGKDIAGMPIELDNAATTSDCELLCAARSSCKAFTYHNCGSPKGKCWLKSGVPSSSDGSSTCAVSFKLVCNEIY